MANFVWSEIGETQIEIFSRAANFLYHTMSTATSPRSLVWITIAVIAVGFGIRLWDLNAKSLWVDEVISYDVAANRPFWSPPTQQGSVIGHCLYDRGPGPLTYAGEWVALHLWKDDRALRIPTAIFGCLSLLAMWALLCAAVERNGARILGLLLWATMLPQVAYAQDARGYALATLLCTVGLWCAVKIWQGGRWHWWWICVGVHLLAFFTSYFSVFQFAAIVLATAWARGWMGDRETRRARLNRTALHLLGGFALLMIPAGLWLRMMLPRSFTMEFGAEASTRSLASLLPNAESLRDLITLLRAFIADLTLTHSPTWPRAMLFKVLSLILWFGLCLSGLIWKGIRSPWPVLWVSLALAPVVLVTFLSTGHFLAPRYLFFLHAPLCLLATWGAEGLSLREKRHPIGVTIAIAFLILLTSAPRLIQFHRTEKANWRDAVALLVNEADPGAIITAGPNADFACLGHYLKKMNREQGWIYFNWFDMPQCSVGEVIDIAEQRNQPDERLLWEGITTPDHLRGLLSTGRPVWFITANWRAPNRPPELWEFLDSNFNTVAVFEGQGDVFVLRSN